MSKLTPDVIAHSLEAAIVSGVAGVVLMSLGALYNAGWSMSVAFANISLMWYLRTFAFYSVAALVGTLLNDMYDITGMLGLDSLIDKLVGAGVQ